MKFTEFLQEEMQSSGNVIKLALKSANLGEEVVRLTKTKENTATENYRIDGNTVKAVWITEEGPMSTEGYSEKDGTDKLERLLDGFTQQNGKLIKKGLHVVNAQIFFYVYIGYRQVGLGLVIIVIGDKILDSIFGKEGFKFPVKLGGECFIRCKHKGRTLCFLNDMRHGKGFTRTSNPQQNLRFHPLPNVGNQLFNGSGLVAGGSKICY